jgi:hypothetical protein
MKIGITGTRQGMNKKQRDDIVSFLLEVRAQELHHGDCVGVDAEAAEIAQRIGYITVCHPPIKNGLRANHKSDIIKEELNHFHRNRNIVDGTDMLLVVPLQNQHQSKGGTWYTHDYAVKKGKPVVIFYPGE